MRTSEDSECKHILNEEAMVELDRYRVIVRADAKKNIEKIQNENCNSNNAKSKLEHISELGDLVTIKRTQFASRLKLKGKFLGPYKLVRVLRHGRYEDEKIDDDEGLHLTCANILSRLMGNWVELPVRRADITIAN